MPWKIHQKFLSLSHLERDSAIGVALGLRFLSTICTPPCCWSSGPSLLLPLLVLGSEPGGRHLHRMCVTPCEAPHLGCWEVLSSTTMRTASPSSSSPPSSRQDLRDLEVGYVVFITRRHRNRSFDRRRLRSTRVCIPYFTV